MRSIRLISPRLGFVCSLVLALVSTGSLWAQKPKPKPKTEAPKSKTAAAEPAPSPPVEIVPTQPIRPTTDISVKLGENLRKFFPKTTAALRGRQGDIAVTVVGDSVANNWQPEEDFRYQMETSWHGFFLQRLANSFIYTGGVRYSGSSLASAQKRRAERKQEMKALGLPGDISRPLPPLAAATSGPAVDVSMLTRDNGTSVQALQWLTTSAFDESPTLVILQYGFTDAIVGASLSHFREHVLAAVRLCKAKQVDVLLAGPPLVVGPPFRTKNGLTRPYATALAEIAKAEGIFYEDFGAAQVEFEFDSQLPLSSIESSFHEHLNSQYPREAQFSDMGPSQHGHRIFSEAIWQTLTEAGTATTVPQFTAIQSPPTAPTLDHPQSNCTLELKWPAETKDKLRYILLGLDRCWRPVETPPEKDYAKPTGEVDLGAAKSLKFLYETPPSTPHTDFRRDLPFGEGPKLQSSLFALYQDHITLVDVPTAATPVSIDIPVSRVEALTDTITITATVTAAPGVTGPAKLKLLWMEKAEELPITLGTEPRVVAIKLPLPAPGEPLLHFKQELKVEVVTPQGTGTTVKELECTRHVGLEKKITLTPLPNQNSRAETLSIPADPRGPALTALADASGLYYVLDLPPNEGSRGSTGASAEVAFTIDARSPQERGHLGFVDPVELEVPWEDGRFEVNKPRDAVFGSGYDRELQKKWFLASVTTLPSGRRQIRLSIPRNYFYLHQWSLGKSGQNSLGINVTVSIAEVDATTGKTSFPPHRVYSLVSPGLARHDALGLAVMELDASAPVRWSVVSY